MLIPCNSPSEGINIFAEQAIKTVIHSMFNGEITQLALLKHASDRLNLGDISDYFVVDYFKQFAAMNMTLLGELDKLASKVGFDLYGEDLCAYLKSMRDTMLSEEDRKINAICTKYVAAYPQDSFPVHLLQGLQNPAMPGFIGIFAAMVDIRNAIALTVKSGMELEAHITIRNYIDIAKKQITDIMDHFDKHVLEALKAADSDNKITEMLDLYADLREKGITYDFTTILTMLCVIFCWCNPDKLQERGAPCLTCKDKKCAEQRTLLGDQPVLTTIAKLTAEDYRILRELADMLIERRNPLINMQTVDPVRFHFVNKTGDYKIDTHHISFILSHPEHTAKNYRRLSVTDGDLEGAVVTDSKGTVLATFDKKHGSTVRFKCDDEKLAIWR